MNTYGPQTRGGGGQGAAGEQQMGPMARHCGNTAIEERLQNIETHLKLPEGQGADGNVECFSVFPVYSYQTRRNISHARVDEFLI